jgi:4-diphosphocytidyl-2-C-methyl-D-erythritol kinase
LTYNSVTMSTLPLCPEKGEILGLVRHPTTVRLRSLAKINLDLRVLNKRPDGYHNIRTVFQTVSLADTIEIAYTPSRRLSINLHSTPDIPGNLIIKAAESLAIPGHFRIRLTKRIPMGGGLGGGSSNAASILLAIPALTNRPVKLDRLLTLATQLGSDVPYFLLGGAALGQSRGTDLSPLPDLKPFPTILVSPGIHVSTPQAYQALNRPARATNHEPRTTTWTLETSSPREWPATNDFEPVVFPQHRHLKLIKGKLRKAGADLALMSGSGSTIFGIFEHRADRDSAVVSLRKDLGIEDKIFPVVLVGRSRYRSLWRRQLRVSAEVKTWPPQNRYA